MSSREIITLQIGNYSNYVGTHWWNIQESYFEYNERNPSEICHDVLFREGKSLKGEVTFTPRLILLDKAQNLTNVPLLSDSFENIEKVFENEGQPVSIEKQSAPEKHDFIKDLEKLEEGHKINVFQKDYKFSETVRTWTDYIRTRYHSKSVCTFQNFGPTDIFHVGSDIYRDLEEDFTEKVRSYLEECDNLQGFQVIVDACDAFGGFADSALVHLQDEYSSKSIFTIPVIPGQFPDTTPLDDVKRSFNIFLTFQKLTENSSLLVPIGTNKTAWRSLGPPTQFPNIIYNHKNMYQTSAILASFLDTVSLKYRLREESNHLHDFVSGLNYYNKKICAASISMPFPMSPHSSLLDTLENIDDSLSLWTELSPGCNVNDDSIFYQRITVRGIPNSKLRDPALPQINSKAYSCCNVAELVHLFLSYRMTTISDVTSKEVPLKTLLPYPKIFSPHVTPDGGVDKSSVRMENFEVSSCPVITGLHCCKSVGRMLESLHHCVKSVNTKRFHHFFGTHMDVDEFYECLEKLSFFGNDFEDFR